MGNTARTIHTAFGPKPDRRPRKKEPARALAAREAGKRAKGRAGTRTLREWRIELQVSQEELHARAQVSVNTISYAENGLRVTSDMVRARIAKAFGVAVDAIDWDAPREARA